MGLFFPGGLCNFWIVRFISGHLENLGIYFSICRNLTCVTHGHYWSLLRLGQVVPKFSQLILYLVSLKQTVTYTYLLHINNMTFSTVLPHHTASFLIRLNCIWKLNSFLSTLWGYSLFVLNFEQTINCVCLFITVS